MKGLVSYSDFYKFAVIASFIVCDGQTDSLSYIKDIINDSFTLTVKELYELREHVNACELIRCDMI